MLLRSGTATAETRFAVRRIDVLAVPFGRVSTVDDGAGPYREIYPRSVSVELLRDRLPALLHHDPRRPFGHVETLRRSADGLVAVLAAAETAAGDEALHLADAGVLYPSIGFSSLRSSRRAGVVRREALLLHELSLVTFPGLDGADVLNVRGAGDRVRCRALQVSGPPCAGKSTRLRELASDGWQTLDDWTFHKSQGAKGRDQVTGPMWGAWHRHLTDTLTGTGPGERVAFVRGDPSPWQAGVEVETLNPGRGMCHARADGDGRPQVTHEWIDRWYARYRGSRPRSLDVSVLLDQWKGRVW